MTVRKLALAAALSAGLAHAAPPPQGAGWTFAHWGMTAAQLGAASGGKVHPDPDMTDFDALDDDVAIGAMKFRVRFGYTHKRLSAVQFDIDSGLDADNACAPVRAWLKQTYGKPALATEGSYITEEWPDRKSGNTVELSRIGDGGAVCHLIFEPGPQLAKYEAELKALERRGH